MNEDSIYAEQFDGNNPEPVDIWLSVKEGHIKKPPVDEWLFYYDETNNFRKFRFDSKKPSGYNVDRALTHDFILGGIAFDSKRKPDADQLMDKLGIQKKNELKANSILKNRDFMKDIGLRRVHIFLEWMLESNITVHFSALNNLYWSIIDLVDEALNEEAGQIMMPGHRMMKDQLFYFVIDHLDEITSILQRYGFPNLEDKNIDSFAREISDFIQENSYDDTPELFFLEVTRQLIKDLKTKKEMVFLSGNEQGVMIDSYVWEYVDAMQMAPNAFHRFDHEITIERELQKYELLEEGKPYDKYKFVNSEQDRFVQISDVFIGILSELFYYTDSIVLKGEGSFPLPTEQQAYGIHLLKKVMATSGKVSPYLHKHLCPKDFMIFRYEFLKIVDSFWDNDCHR
jgi:hypothetical protein